MENKLHKKYGLLTAVAMVVGIVIGSGVFFKAEKVLSATGGNLPLGILAWGLGGAIMLICAYTFSQMATRYEYVNGVVDYAEVTMGEKYGYFVGWFMSVIYYPTLTGALAWVTARYTCVLFGRSIVGPEAMILTGFYLVLSYALNTLSPVLAGKFQVSTTFIKLVPLYLMAIVGTVVGLSNGLTVQNFTNAVMPVDNMGRALFTAVTATAFAYEGWIISTGINAELKDAKRTLPRALLIGCGLVAVTYIVYYIGLAGSISNEEMMKGGEQAVAKAFKVVFGNFGGTALFVFIVISCMGTLNGLMLGCTRGLYALAARKQGPSPKTFGQVDPVTNMPSNSSVFGLMLSAAWMLFFYGTVLTGIDGNAPWLGSFGFDVTELPIITVYALYIPIFVMMMVKEKDLSPFNRFVMPILAVCGCAFMMVAAFFAHRETVLWYLIVFVAVMALGAAFAKKRSE